MFSVRVMSLEDSGFAVTLTDTMGWELVEQDFEFMMKLEPEGCFLLLDGPRKAGLATTISLGRIGWIGNVIVKNECRGKGGGRKLVEFAVQYLKSGKAETVGLYAYMNRTHFYEQLDFRKDAEISVLKGKGTETQARSLLKKADDKDIPRIVEFDCKCFGASREKLLKPLLLDKNNICYTAPTEGQIAGYAMAKTYGQAAWIGPLNCTKERRDIAADLLRALLGQLGKSQISVCVRSDDAQFISILADLGFAESFRVARMILGAPMVDGCMYAAESLERG